MTGFFVGLELSLLTRHGGSRGQRLVDWRLKAPYVLNGHIFGIGRACPHILIKGCKYLRIEYLKSSNAIHHSLQLLEFEMKTI